METDECTQHSTNHKQRHRETTGEVPIGGPAGASIPDSPEVSGSSPVAIQAMPST